MWNLNTDRKLFLDTFLALAAMLAALRTIYLTVKRFKSKEGKEDKTGAALHLHLIALMQDLGYKMPNRPLKEIGICFGYTASLNIAVHNKQLKEAIETLNALGDLEKASFNHPLPGPLLKKITQARAMLDEMWLYQRGYIPGCGIRAKLLDECDFYQRRFSFDTGQYKNFITFSEPEILGYQQLDCRYFEDNIYSVKQLGHFLSVLDTFHDKHPELPIAIDFALKTSEEGGHSIAFGYDTLEKQWFYADINAKKIHYADTAKALTRFIFVTSCLYNQSAGFLNIFYRQPCPTSFHIMVTKQNKSAVDELVKVFEEENKKIFAKPITPFTIIEDYQGVQRKSFLKG